MYVDHVSCGDGADSLEADTADVVPADCETVYRETLNHLIGHRIGVHADGTASIDPDFGRGGPGTYGSVEPDTGSVRLLVRVRGRWIRAGHKVCTGYAACPQGFLVRVSKRVQRLLHRTRTLRARVTFVFLGGGAIPDTESAVLKVSRLPS
jgi:hypothetical protein